MKRTTCIRINTIQKVKDFVSISEKFPGLVSVREGSYTVNGKSILGIFSLSLELPVQVDASCEDLSILQEYIRYITEHFPKK